MFYRTTRKLYLSGRDNRHYRYRYSRDLQYLSASLISVATGQLCDAQERVRMFKSETPFKKLVSETAITNRSCTHPSICREILQMDHVFRHMGGEEVTSKDVNLVDLVWKLDKSPLNEKLRQFCDAARWLSMGLVRHMLHLQGHGYRLEPIPHFYQVLCTASTRKQQKPSSI